MAAERTNAGDPERTLKLLWREQDAGTQRGPRPGLSVDAVVAAATAIADAEGLRAMTMRRVAQDLGVVAMTLYTYVPGKAELLDLMLDAAYAAMPHTDTAGRPWRERVTAVAAENRALFERHPWVVGVATSRPLLGPGALAKYEHELSAFDGLRLDDVDLDSALTFVLEFVRGWARSRAEAETARCESRMTDEQWWATNGPLLARVLDERTYPLASRVGSAVGAAHGTAYDPQHAYDFGLGRVLDGLETLIGS
ncbi:TetR family transcriptional regulator [Microbispora cellulosiformans]|uniref:TetR family transcriptional regulator n=1 Tax=Microbispora cellulosiformans TaxID=2614688 RepID=A0A5J5K463_9ACTN|nr:TetR/AcrR family transcriptional regulator C-terminal domain-containing protein [Microbispora cellulosiformans]KAA9379167.1 TetR family transcriptional regulator [Microbispora cellulosiformans]